MSRIGSKKASHVHNHHHHHSRLSYIHSILPLLQFLHHYKCHVSTGSHRSEFRYAIIFHLFIIYNDGETGERETHLANLPH